MKVFFCYQQISSFSEKYMKMTCVKLGPNDSVQALCDIASFSTVNTGISIPGKISVCLIICCVYMSDQYLREQLLILSWKLFLYVTYNQLHIYIKLFADMYIFIMIYSAQNMDTLNWSIQKKHVIKCVSDLRQVGGFLRVLRFAPPIKLTATIQLKYC